MKIKIIILYIYTFVSYLMLYAYTTISVLLSLFFNLFNWQKAVHRIIKLWSKGSFILIANHSSLFDIMAIMSIYQVSWFGREYLINVPIFGRFPKTINYIPMKTSDIRNTKKLAIFSGRNKNH